MLLCLKESNRCVFIYPFFTLSNAKHGQCFVIGLAASATSKGPRVKTTEPMVSIKVPNCSIQLGWILVRDCFAKNYMGSRPEVKKCDFFIWSVRTDVWMNGCYCFFRRKKISHRVESRGSPSLSCLPKNNFVFLILSRFFHVFSIGCH